MLRYLKPVSVTLLLILGLSGCATVKPLSSVDRTRYKTVAVDPNVTVPEKYLYRDITGNRARGIGGNFGLIGALVGGAVGATSEGNGHHRFDQSAGQQKVDLRRLVYSHVVSTLKGSGMFTVTEANADAQFNIEVVSYGVGPVTGHNLGAIIAAKASLSAGGKQIWSRAEIAQSRTTAPLEEFERNPALWPKTLDEAAVQLARQLVLYEKSIRQ